MISVLQKLQCVRLQGDFEIEPGLKLYKTPGHTPGGQSVAAETANGTYIMMGDTAYFRCNLFPKMDKMKLLDGSEIKITPYPDPYAPAIPFGRAGLIRDYNAWYQSIFRLKLLIKGEEYALPGHDPCLVGKVVG